MSLRIIVLGTGGVGKSALVSQFVQGAFLEDYDPTIEDLHSKHVEINGEAMRLEILDTAGQDDYTPLRSSFMGSGDGFILVFAIDDDHSFEELADIVLEIDQVQGGTTGTVPQLALVGNKLDLDDSRAVLVEEGEACAAQHACPFSETSAKLNRGVHEVFMSLARRIIEARRETDVSPTSSVEHSVVPTAKQSSSSSKPKHRCVLL